MIERKFQLEIFMFSVLLVEKLIVLGSNTLQMERAYKM